MRKEMEARIRAAKEKFMEDTDGQLEATTKDTMHQNEQMGSELAFQVSFDANMCEDTCALLRL